MGFWFRVQGFGFWCVYSVRVVGAPSTLGLISRLRQHVGPARGQDVPQAHVVLVDYSAIGTHAIPSALHSDAPQALLRSIPPDSPSLPGLPRNRVQRSACTPKPQCPKDDLPGYLSAARSMHILIAGFWHGRCWRVILLPGACLES